MINIFFYLMAFIGTIEGCCYHDKGFIKFGRISVSSFSSRFQWRDEVDVS